jgi:peptidyl-prolyl cis-trans isomerase-like protein 2
LSLQPFKNPVAAIGEGNRADVFDLLNIVPYIRKYGTSESSTLALSFVSRRTLAHYGYGYVVDPATGTPLTTNELVKLNFFKVGS